MAETTLLDRLYTAAQAKTDKEFAGIIEKSPQAVYEAKRKGKIPDAWVRIVAEKTGVSADWIFFERGPFKTDTRKIENTDTLDRELLRKAINEIEEASEIIRKSIKAENRAEITLKVYELLKKEKDVKNLFEIISLLD